MAQERAFYTLGVENLPEMAHVRSQKSDGLVSYSKSKSTWASSDVFSIKLASLMPAPRHGEPRILDLGCGRAGGLGPFHNIVNDTRLHGLPMVLETPVDVIGEDGKKFEDKSIWARETKMLESLVGMDRRV
ncbi:hypothetical protein EK21DRAFT_114447 [Setomelanomma holmii]|uniref:Methyltransferase n=1 Tax=Setomelanomma holmii TaxID=210430 RepID=A0A9P4LIC3_9PLEO|nr:hypothetical protein EK21DRAFT_114447 [Setomelanomma holmii]